MSDSIAHYEGQTSDSNSLPPLAIVGVGCLFPKANGPEAYWHNIKEGVDAITAVPESHWNPQDYFDGDPAKPDMTYARRGGFIDPVEFDPLHFGIAPNNIEATDTTQLLGMYVAEQALLDAGYETGSGVGDGRAFNRDRCSVIMGVTGTLELVIPLGARLGHPIWRKALDDAGVDKATADDVVSRIAEGYVPWQENSFPGLLGNVAAGRIANRFDLGGTNCVVDAACASSLSAIHMAAMELYAGRSDMAITGGLDTFNDIFMYMCFSKTPALSPTGNSKPFSADGDGTILGEGLGVVVLKRLDDAVRDGDKVYCVIKGIGTSSDGKGNAIYAPSVQGQTKALRDAYLTASVTPNSIELIEAHGTGTKVGDAIEVKAIEEVYGDSARPTASDAASNQSEIQTPWCAMGSVKSMVGHTKAAAGVAGLIKAALAVNHKVLPPTIKIDQPLELLRESKNVYANTSKRPWLGKRQHPRRAALSAFGFGGSNFHCVVEEHTPSGEEADRNIDWSGNVQLLPLSAPAVQDLHDKLEAVGSSWPKIWESVRSFAAQQREKFKASDQCRLVLVIDREKTDVQKLIANAGRMLIAKASERSWTLPDGAYFGQSSEKSSGQSSGQGDVAFVFPGQGSQRVNMLRDLACQFPMMLTSLDAANADFENSDIDARLSDLIFPLPAYDDDVRQQQDVKLRDTRVAQPAIGAVSMGAAAVLALFGIRPDSVAGHSFGELSALAIAGRINERSLYRLARQRGALMNAQSTEGRDGDQGTMLAVQADRSEVERVLASSNLPLTVANHNAPRQTVVSGASSAIADAERIFGVANMRCKQLPVAAAFHSSLVAGAGEPFARALEHVGFDTGDEAISQSGRPVSVFANTTGAIYPRDTDQARQLLANQLARPVEFVRQIETMHQAGVRLFIEVGPGNALAGLIRSILERMKEAGEAEASVIALDASAGKRHGEYDLACVLAASAAFGTDVDLMQWDDPTRRRPIPESNPRRLKIALTGANYKKPRDAKPATVKTPYATVPATKNETATKTDRVEADPKPTSTPTPPPASRTPVATSRSKATSTQSEPTPETYREPVTQPNQHPQPSTPVPLNQAISQSPEQLAYAMQVTQQHILTLQHMQEQTAQLHRQYLEGQDTSQRTIQQMVLQQQQLLSASLGTGQPVSLPAPVPAVPAAMPTKAASPYVAPSPMVPAPHAAQPMAPMPPSTPVAPPVQIPLAPTAPRPAPAPQISSPTPRAPVVSSPAPTPVAPIPAAVSTPASTAAPAASGGSQFESLLLEVVADKTGYPVDMLELDMSLDADLGIDSIKRVEILSAFQDRAPHAPMVKPEDLGTLQTLRQIIEFVDGAAGAQPAQSSGPAATQADHADPAPTTPIASNGSLEKVLLEVVADKTGYPVDMLDLDMSLDADLGIDSIKRVEILSAFQDRVPDAPLVKPEDLGALQTLRQIVSFLDGSPPTESSTSPPASPVGASETPDPFELAVAGKGLERLVPTIAPLTQDRQRIALDKGATIIISDDGEGLSQLLASQLNARGFITRVLGIAEEWDAITEAAAVVVVAPTRPDNAFNRFAFSFIQNARLPLGASPQHSGTAPLLVGVCRLDGCFGYADEAIVAPESAGLCGVIKTAAREWEDIHCKVIDLAPTLAGEEAARHLVDELMFVGPVEVGLSAGGATAIQLVSQSDFETVESPLAQDDVVVISGGARGVTAEIAVALAEHCQPTLVLLGRSALPEDEPGWLDGLTDEAAIKRALIANWSGGAPAPKAIQAAFDRLLAGREIRHNILRMTSLGSRVIYRSVDIVDAATVAGVLAEIRNEFGPVRGIVHGAGVLADRLIVDKTTEQFDRVFGTKVDGLKALLHATESDDLRILVTFASSTARFGRIGQSDYAAANEVLNKIAQQQARQRSGCKVISVNWGPWDGGMVTPALKEMFASEGVNVIPMQAGARYLVAEMATAKDGPVEVVILGEGSPLDVDVNISKAEPEAGEDAAVEPATDQSTEKTAQAKTVAKLSLVFERQIEVDSHEFLRSHVIGGRAVLPMAMMIEWMAHGAMHGNPGMSFAGFNDLRVFRGVKLEARQSLTLSVLVSSPRFDAAGEHIDVELRCGDVLHARTAVLLKPQFDSAQSDESPLPALAPRFEFDQIYTPPMLFHGDDLQGIRAIDACDQSGIVGFSLAAKSPAAWMTTPWRSAWLADPLALDVAFQLMILWSIDQADAPSLPTGATRYRQFRARFPQDGVQVVCRITESKAYAAIADIDFIDSAGELVARMEGYECVVEGALRESFEQNRLLDHVQA